MTKTAHHPDARRAEFAACVSGRHICFAMAESCSGGQLAAALSGHQKLGSHPERGYVAYSVDAKCGMLGIALALLFLASFVLHWTQSAGTAARDALARGEAAPMILGYLADPQLWFESFQNWQSEFLATAVLVVLAIYLRQRELAESKAVAAPHRQTGE